MTGVQAQAAKLLEQIKSMSFSAARRSGHHLDIGKVEVMQMALEKQVPEDPYREIVGLCPDGIEIWQDFCPRCNFDFEDYEFNYCPNCGQAVDQTDRRD